MERAGRVKWWAVVACMLLTFGQSVGAQQPISREIAYSGFLTDGAGQALNGAWTLTFSLYTESIGDTGLLWSETQTVEVTDGEFSVRLGSVASIPAGVAFDQQYWLGVKLGEFPHGVVGELGVVVGNAAARGQIHPEGRGDLAQYQPWDGLGLERDCRLPHLHRRRQENSDPGIESLAPRAPSAPLHTAR